MTTSIKYSDIQPYLEKKLVSEQVHPEDPAVRIFNYTQTCQFEQAWDDITRHCRGLIMNVETGEVIARPFPKFFNYQEHVAKGWPIPSGVPIVSEKLDGSLGILYSLNGKPWIATRGSFTSDQAIWATEWWRERFSDVRTSNEFTHLFEIIYPQNRIVVSYDFSGLVHLATRRTDTGEDVTDATIQTILDANTDLRTAKRIETSNLEELSKLDEPNSEGFVAYFPDSGERLKIKFPEYVRLHRLVTGVNEIAIWEMLRDGTSFNELLEKVPDEFHQWVDSVTSKLRGEWAKLWGEAQLAVQMVQGKPTRKEQALWIMQNAKHVSGVVFSLLDGEDRKAALQVWRMVRPHGARAFKTDIDL